jgi:glycosyltransferase involved in cell wall biosynthesis
MTTKIKIAHIITRMDRGGAPDIVRLLFEKLPADAFELTLIYGLTTVPSQKSSDFIKRLKDKAVLIPSLRRNINLFYDVCAFLQLCVILRRGSFDMVHTHTAKAGALGRIAAKIARVPKIIYSTHGHDFYGYFGRIGSCLTVWAERVAALFCDKIHALTELEKKDLLSFKICPEVKIEVISSGVELDFLRPSQADIDKLKNVARSETKFLKVGFIGRLEPVKGPKFFIEAAKSILTQRQNVRFILIGDGSLKEGLRRDTACAGLKEYFDFAGWKEDVRPDLWTMDLVVLPSINEAVGRSALEAQAAGVPVVATKVGGIPETVKDGVTGILVESNNADALAVAILLLLDDEKKRKEMGEAARGWVDEKFSDRLMVEKFADLYRELMRQK